ncbi:BolA family transcriptional regulator [Candidatus Marinamargulisbacteria bacterium SCGC AG-414-C22]|nr:BolA family transcriptional regulator [Candidatus Marinamargulisbacteria bacterium SCGC AG-414-C22]
MKVKIAKWLMEVFDAWHFSIQDQSHKHVGHQGTTKVGDTHFDITIVSESFVGVSKVQRHRQVYEQCDTFFKEGLHALAIKTYTTEEWSKCNGQ